MDYAALEIFATGLIVVFILVFILALIAYVLTAIGVFRICNDLGCVHYAYFGWIPFANTWIIAFLAAECNPNMMGGYSSRTIAWVYLCCTISLGWVVGWIGLGVVIWPVLLVADIYFRAQIIGRYYDNSMKWLLAFFAPIGMFLAGLRADEGSKRN